MHFINFLPPLLLFFFPRSYKKTLITAALYSKKEYKTPSHTPFVTNNSHYDHDDDKLTVWPGRHGGPSLGTFLSHG